jgi:hypothetical protein
LVRTGLGTIKLMHHFGSIYRFYLGNSLYFSVI